MKVSSERLRIIGELIGVYREERRSNSQNSWTQKRFCKDICSPNTLKSIETGGLARSIEVYDALVKKFDLHLGEFEAIDDALYALTQELYVAIAYYEGKKIKEITLKLLRILMEVKSFIYYSELYSLFEDIQRYYVQNIFISEDKIERLLKIKDILPFLFQNLFQLILYPTIKMERIYTRRLYELHMNKLTFQEEYVAFMVYQLDYLYENAYYLHMKELGEHIISYLQATNNQIRLFEVYCLFILWYWRVDRNSQSPYMKKAETILHEQKLPDLIKGHYYCMLAHIHNQKNAYEKALSYYQKLINLKHFHDIRYFIYMADCQRRLHKDIQLPLIKDEVFQKFPPVIKSMYKYFIFQEKVPEFVKEGFILKKIAPVLYDESYIDVFRHEIMYLVDKSNHYKSLHTFEKIVAHNLQVRE